MQKVTPQEGILFEVGEIFYDKILRQASKFQLRRPPLLQILRSLDDPQSFVIKSER
jgi:hypothetical protein